MSHVTIAVDNGSTGSISVIGPARTHFMKVPTRDQLHFGKKGSIMKRLDRQAFKTIIEEATGFATTNWIGYSNVRIYVEKPFTGRFVNAMVSAARFHEATIITFEDFDNGRGIGYQTVASGDWQRHMLGAIKGRAALKKASVLRGIELFPQFRDAITKHGDADSLLMARYFHMQ